MTLFWPLSPLLFPELLELKCVETVQQLGYGVPGEGAHRGFLIHIRVFLEHRCGWPVYLFIQMAF